MQGRYKIAVVERGQIVSETRWIKNKIMGGISNGTGVIARQLIGDVTYPIAISSAAIGTGSNTPTAADTALQTPTLTGIVVRPNKSATASRVILQFYITDAELANGTYREFGLYAGTQLFARSLILPTFTKATGQDVIISYEITIN